MRTRHGASAAQPSGRSAVEPTTRLPRRSLRAVVALAAPVLFTPPVLAIADREATLLGVPLHVAYVFLAWFVGIAIIAVLAHRSRR